VAYLVKRDATYYVAYREGGRGSPKRYVKAGKRRREAERLKAVVEANLLQGYVGLPERKTFGEFAQTWLDGRTAQVRTKTEDLEARLIRNYLLPEFGQSMLHTIKRDRIRAWVAQIVEARSRWVARRCLGLLKTILQDAKGDGYLRENSAWEVPLPAPPHREMLVPSVEEVCDVLGALPERWRPLAFVAALTGLRWGELGALEWRDLDLEQGKLHVRRALPANTREVGEPKSWAGRRTVDLFLCVVQILLDVPQISELVFPGERGGHLNHRWFMKAYGGRPYGASGFGYAGTISGTSTPACSLRSARGRCM